VKSDPHGDTVLAQISPTEVALLLAHGGSGRVNPKTGIRQFFGDEGGGGLGGRGYGGAGPSGGDRNSGNGGTHGGSRAPGGSIAAAAANGDASARAAQAATERSLGTDGRGPATGTETSPGLFATGKLTPYGAPVRVNALGIETALPENPSTTNPSTPTWGGWKDEVDSYNQAARQWNARTLKDRIANAMAPLGLTSVAPDLSRPATFVDGTYHIGLNPAAAIGSIVGGLVAPGLGVPTSALAGGAYNALGGRDVVLTGSDIPKTWDPNGAATVGASSSPAASGPASSPSSPSGGTHGAQLLPPIAGNGVTTIPPSGSTLPPTTAPISPPPQQNLSSAQLVSIPGPSPYYWQKPQWMY
jgi:hypothetical protein